MVSEMDEAVTRPETVEKLARLQEILRGNQRMLIVLQDFPDPDAMGSAAALRELANVNGVACTVACGGVVGRAENRVLMRYLDINLQTMATLDVDQFDLIGMVDTQPATGNNSLDREVVPDIVIDHHPVRRETRRSPFLDIRKRYGATSTMLYEYLVAAGMTIGVPLATGLLYGIRSDTNDLGREATQADIDAFISLYPIANKRMLGRIVMERLPPVYFQIMSVGLLNARVQGSCVFSDLGEIENPDMLGEVADLLLRNEQSTWAMCYGRYGDRVLISLRTSQLDADAGKFMHRIVGRRGTGGGHNAMAGGQIPLHTGSATEVRQLGRTIVARLLRLTGTKETTPCRLVRPPK